MKRTSRNGITITLAVVFAFGAAQPAISDGLGVDVGGSVSVNTNSVSNTTSGASNQVQNTVTTASNTAQQTANSADGALVTAGVGSADGNRARFCLGIFRKCPDSGQDADQQAASNQGNGLDGCVALGGGCSNGGQDANQNAAANPNNGLIRGNSDDDRAMSVAMPFVIGPDTVPADRFVGVLLMSADDHLLGMIENASWMEDGTVQVTVQNNPAIGVARSVSTLKFTPTSVPNDRITFGVSVQQFVASMS